jgi:hypothetical protein
VIEWPDALRPEVAAIHAHNELETDLAPEAIWPWLVRAARWREFYSNCRGLRFVNDRGPDLRLGTEFTWWTFGVPVTTTVDVFEPNARLAWTGRGLGARGHHAWLLERRGNGARGGTRIVTEETQRGIAPSLLRAALRPGLLHFHQRWLEGLVRAARLGHPDTVKEISS